MNYSLGRRSFGRKFGLPHAPSPGTIHHADPNRLMPTLRRFGSVTVRMYADDHRPPHFHIVGPDFEVIVRIADRRIIAGRARPGQIAEALAWAAEERHLLTVTWEALNERG